MKKTIHLELSINLGSICLIDALTGEIFGEGKENINNLLNLLDVAEVPYTLQIRSK